MRLFVNSPMASDMIIDLLTGYKENDVEFKFVKKTGIKMEFEVSGTDATSACNLAKALIKETDMGKVLYFSVEAG